MNKFVLIVVMIAMAACQSDSKGVERALAENTKELRAIKDILAKGGGVGGAGAGQQRPQRPEPDRAKTYAVPIDGVFADGPPEAKVTLVKASEYACPYCEKVRPTMDELKKKYGNDLRVVYKQMVVHPKNATAASLAFCAANKQGKAKEMDNLIWEKGFKSRQLDNSDVAAAEAGAPTPGQPPGQPQKCWETAAGCPFVVGYAKELGLNMDKFKGDMKGDCQQAIQKDQKEFQQFGVNATPGFFVNGRFLSGAMPIENFSALIDEELKKANERIQQGTAAADYYKTWVMDKGLKQLEKT